MALQIFGGSGSSARTPKVADLTYPVMLPHRGAGELLFPGDNQEAFRIGVDYGLPAIDGGDLRLLKDGGFLNYHASTLQVDTSISGSPWTLTAAQARTLNLTFGSSWVPPNGTTGLRLTTWDAIVADIGSRAVLFPELKVDGSNPWPAGTCGQKFLERLQKQNLTKSVVVQSASLNELVPLIAGGVETMLLPFGDQSTAPNQAANQAARNAGVQHLALDLFANTPSVVSTYTAMGFKVWVYTPARQYDVNAWLAAGAVGIFSNDPVYAGGDVSKYRKTTDDFGLGTWSPGMIGPDDGFIRRGSFANGRWFPTTVAATCLWGQFSPVANPASTYTVNLTVCFDNLGSDATRHADIVVAAPDDRYFDAGVARAVNSGYIVGVRPAATNTFQIWEVVNGVTTSKANVSSTAMVAPVTLTAGLTATAKTSLTVAAIPADIPSGTKFALPTLDANGKPQIATTTALASAGATTLAIASITPTAAVANGAVLPQAVPLTIQVTPTQIIVTRTDVGTTATANSSAVRGGYIHAGQNNNNGASGMQVSYCNVSIT